MKRECVVTIRSEGGRFTWDVRDVGLSGDMTRRGTADTYAESYTAALAKVKALGAPTRVVMFFTLSEAPEP